MGPSQFWDGDPWLFAAYREAKRRTDEERSRERWQIGAYVYEAICCTSPLLNAFSSRRQAYPWPDEPFEARRAREMALSPQEAEQADHARFAEWLLMHGPD